MSVLVRFLAMGLALWVAGGVSPARAATTWHVVDAGYVSLDGYRTNEAAQARIPDGDRRVPELDRVFRGEAKAASAKLVTGYLEKLRGGVEDIRVAPLQGESLRGGTVDPASVTLWLGTLCDIATVPDVYYYQTNTRANQFLCVVFGFYLVHLKTGEILFNEQAMVLVPWRSDRAVTADGLPGQLLAKATEAVQRETGSAARFRKALQAGRYAGGAGEVYAVSARGVQVPANVEKTLREHSAPAVLGEHLGSLRRTVAYQVAAGLSRTRRVLPLLPDEYLGDVQVGGTNRAGLWAVFNLGALQDPNLPPGALRDRSRDGYVVVSGRLPAPDYEVHVAFEYQEVKEDPGDYQDGYLGTAQVKLEERASGHRRSLGTPFVGRSRANYVVGRPPTARGLLLAVGDAFDKR